MNDTLNQDQKFTIAEMPVADSVNITVLSHYTRLSNGFSEISFEGKSTESTESTESGNSETAFQTNNSR